MVEDDGLQSEIVKIIKIQSNLVINTLVWTVSLDLSFFVVEDFDVLETDAAVVVEETDLSSEVFDSVTISIGKLVNIHI